MLAFAHCTGLNLLLRVGVFELIAHAPVHGKGTDEEGDDVEHNGHDEGALVGAQLVIEEPDGRVEPAANQAVGHHHRCPDV